MDEKPQKGPPSGRPRKDNRQLRSEWLKARVTLDEKHRAAQLMRDAGQTESDFVRDAVLNGRILISRPRAPDPAIISQLQRIGNNLNQIAKICNTTGNDRRARFIEFHLDDELRPVLQHLLKLYAP
jgi:Mobilization protein NikA